MNIISELKSFLDEKLGFGRSNAEPIVDENFFEKGVLFEQSKNKGVTEILEDFKEQAKRFEVKVCQEQEPPAAPQTHIPRNDKNSCFIAASNEQKKALEAIIANTEKIKNRIDAARVRISELEQNREPNNTLSAMMDVDFTTSSQSLNANQPQISSLAKILSSGGTLGNKDTVEKRLEGKVSNSARPKFK